MPDLEGNEELFDELIDKESETLRILLETKVSRTAITIEGFLQTQLLQGASKKSIQETLLRDLETGGQIFGEFRNAIKATAKGNLTRLRTSAEVSELGDDIQYRWVAVLRKTCPDCMDRHGLVKIWDEWELFGLPQTGHTVCKEHCQCVLLPADVTELAPVRRG